MRYYIVKQKDYEHHMIMEDELYEVMHKTRQYDHDEIMTALQSLRDSLLRKNMLLCAETKLGYRVSWYPNRYFDTAIKFMSLDKDKFIFINENEHILSKSEFQNIVRSHDGSVANMKVKPFSQQCMHGFCWLED